MWCEAVSIYVYTTEAILYFLETKSKKSYSSVALLNENPQVPPGEGGGLKEKAKDIECGLLLLHHWREE